VHLQDADQLVLLAQRDHRGDVVGRSPPLAGAQHHAHGVGARGLDRGERAGLTRVPDVGMVDPPHDERLTARLHDVAATDVQPDGGGRRLHVQQD
jgi:hypothetical protein